MKRLILLAIIYITLSLPEGMGQDLSGKIDSLMTTYFRNGVFNGTVLVAKKGEVIYKKAFGTADRDWDIPNTIDTRFKIGSISKPFTALLIVQLAEEGKLDLNGTVSDYIPDYKGKLGDSITIHQLLTHTSGILTSLDAEEEAVQEKLHHELRDIIGYAESADLYFKPGTGFRYSNIAYNMLAYIIEKVTGKKFEVVLKERILDPAGLHNTSHFKNALIEHNMARGYEYKLLQGLENATYYDDSYPLGPGSLCSTVEDLYLFDRALYTDKLISDEYKTRIFTPASTGKYGYGWFINRKQIGTHGDSLLIADHTGSINGFGSYMARIMSDSSLVIVLKNQRTDTYIEPAFTPEIGNQIISIMYGDYVDLPKPSIARHIALLIGHQDIDSAIAEYYRVKKSCPGDYSMDESELNRLGIELLFRFKMADEAAKIFEINMREFPRSYNTYDSYAYVLMQKGDLNNSIKYYKKGLEVLKNFPGDNDQDAIKGDAEKALVYIREMENKIKE